MISICFVVTCSRFYPWLFIFFTRDFTHGIILTEQFVIKDHIFESNINPIIYFFFVISLNVQSVV